MDVHLHAYHKTFLKVGHMKILIDIFHGIPRVQNTHRKGYLLLQHQRLSVLHPDVVIDYDNSLIAKADTIFISTGLDFEVTGSFDHVLGGFAAEHYYLIGELRAKKCYWLPLGYDANVQIAWVLRAMNARTYHHRHIIPKHLNLAPTAFKTLRFDLPEHIIGNQHVLSYAAKDQNVNIDDELTISKFLKREWINLQHYTFALGNGEKGLTAKIATAYVKKVKALKGEICMLLPFNDTAFNKELVDNCDLYGVELICTPDFWNTLPREIWEKSYIDKNGYLLPQHYRAQSGWR